MEARMKEKRIDIYPTGIAYIHTNKGTKAVPINLLFKSKFIKKIDIAFITSKYLYYRKNGAARSIEIPSELKLFIVLKNKYVFLFGIYTDPGNGQEILCVFPKMPNQIDANIPSPLKHKIKAICLNHYQPSSIDDALQKFILMPFSDEPDFSFTPLKLKDFLEFLMYEEK
jgi:hypothetical protein